MSTRQPATQGKFSKYERIYAPKKLRGDAWEYRKNMRNVLAGNRSLCGRAKSACEAFLSKTGSWSVRALSNGGFSLELPPEALSLPLSEQRDILKAEISRMDAEIERLRKVYGYDNTVRRRYRATPYTEEELMAFAIADSLGTTRQAYQAKLGEIGAAIRRAHNDNFSAVFLDVARARLPQSVFAVILNEAQNLWRQREPEDGK